MGKLYITIYLYLYVYKISVHIRGLHELATFKGGHRTHCVGITSGPLLCGGCVKRLVKYVELKAIDVQE